MNNTNRDSITLPSEQGREKTVLSLAEKWGADAFRDSDGTKLSDEIINSGRDIYSTLCLVRADQEWARAHPEQTACKFLMSKPVAARGETLEIEPMSTYWSDCYVPDMREESFAYWEVMDRTEGSLVSSADWKYDAKCGVVTISETKKGHLYTVSFMVRLIWDVTSRHNHITNNWTGEHVMAVDPSYPETYKHLMSYFDKWLKEHPRTNVVRFTTLAYHMPSDCDQDGEKGVYGDSYGYTDTVSPPALAAFEEEFGYRLRAEDFIDQGYNNVVDRVPSKRYRDWMTFTQRRVERYARDLTGKAHAAGKRTAFYHGDHWIGMEPYKPEFKDAGFDIVIAVPHSEVTIRRLTDMPGNYVRELRMRPYFFPNELGVMDPAKNSQQIWAKLRRGILRNPIIDRIGWGGYLSLALEYPHFIEHITQLCDEFRLIKAKTQREKPVSYFKVAVISAWGKLRSWAEWSIEGERFGSTENATMTLECLGGLPVEVEFLSFDDIKTKGIPKDVKVVINSGDAGTAWSGGRYWQDPEISATLREWVADGGGFIGIGGATAREFQGRVFQLGDVMGIEKETGNSNHRARISFSETEEHFIKVDVAAPVKLGTERSFVSLRDKKAKVLYANDNHVLMSANEYGDGRAVYMAGLPYTPQNSRLLLRALLWARREEDALKKCFSINQLTDCAIYSNAGIMAVANNADSYQSTTIYDDRGNSHTVQLAPYEIKWLNLENNKE